MTSHELAKKLLEGPDLPVTVRGYEGGVDIINNVDSPATLQLDTYEEWYYGSHEYINGEDDYGYDGTKKHIQAIHIGA